MRRNISNLQISSKNRKFHRLQYGISLIEILIVISCILFLIALIPIILRPRATSSMRNICQNRIKNLLLGIFTYADENNGRLPILADSNSLNEISKQTARILLHNIGVDVNSDKFINESFLFSDNFYCPANIQQVRFRKSYWYSSDDYHTTGYFFIIDTKTGRAKIQGTGEKQWVTRLNIPKSTERELIIDIVISDQVNYKPPKYPFGNFEKCPGTIFGKDGFESTSHLLNDTKAGGGNIGFNDSHVEWRSFSEMEKRYGDNPVCWW